jgi:DNA-binding Lrp family transcriptional regulator
MITAFVLITCGVADIPETAQALADLDGISEVYSVSGEWDLIAVVRVGNHDDLAEIVTERLRKVPGVKSTETLIAWRAYSRHDLDRIFSLGFEDSGQPD